MENTEENLEKEEENTEEVPVEGNLVDDKNKSNIEKNDDQDLDDIVKERDALKDKLMRALAESENVRKRAIKDRQESEIYAISKMSKDILSVYDNLQRALDLADNTLDEKSLPMIEGLEITKKDLIETFKRNNIEKIEPVSNDKFDPKLHQAMMEMPSDEIEKGHIIQVLSVGFLIGERLLRASKVTVSSGKKQEEPKNKSADSN